jgi:hypothetical protein
LLPAGESGAPETGSTRLQSGFSIGDTERNSAVSYNSKEQFMNAEKATRLITVPDWPKYHPWPSQAGLRYLIFHATRNGFVTAIRRCGRRVLIDEAAFFAWVNQQAGDHEHR